MELWIRSQDKLKLVKVNYVYVMENKINSFSIYGETIDSGPIIGTYKTKKRALEVLDEIEKLIKPITIFQNCQVDKSTIEKIKETGYCVVNNDARVEQISQVFYQMPED